jgi:hypothetical protein
MRCPPEIAEIVCEILRTGLLRIRFLANASRSVVEADHLHNLPGLLADYKPELLDYYWEVERPRFIEHSTPEDVRSFEPLWNALVKHVTLPTGRAFGLLRS